MAIYHYFITIDIGGNGWNLNNSKLYIRKPGLSEARFVLLCLVNYSSFSTDVIFPNVISIFFFFSSHSHILITFQPYP